MTGEPPRVLIVDDEVLLRLVLADFLECAGFRVIEAGSGDEAAGILERDGLAIDLVLTDVRMPGKMDGFQLALWMREHHPSIPVFLASGDIGKAQTTYELAPGQAFFLKPYSMDVIVGRIRETLGRPLAAAN